MDEDKKQEQKKGDIDRSKLEADVKGCKDTAAAVSTNAALRVTSAVTTPVPYGHDSSMHAGQKQRSCGKPADTGKAKQAC